MAEAPAKEPPEKATLECGGREEGRKITIRGCEGEKERGVQIRTEGNEDISKQSFAKEERIRRKDIYRQRSRL